MNPKFYWMPSSDWALLDDRNSSLPADGILQQVQCSATGSSSAGSVRPNIATFMTAAGTDFATASDVIYGVIGSNRDLRDWGAIMASSNVLQAARVATAAMYNNSSLDYLTTAGYIPTSGYNPATNSTTTILASAGNFAYLKVTIPDPNDTTHTRFVDTFYLIAKDSRGNQLSSAANPSGMAHLVNFGFDTSVLTTIESQLSAQGFSLAAHAWPSGFLGNSGGTQSNAGALSQIANALAAIESILKSYLTR